MSDQHAFSALMSRLADIVDKKNVISDEGDLAPFLVDGRGTYKGSAICLVKPASTAEVASVVKLCASENIAIVPIGGNTGVVGGAVARADGPLIMLSLARMNKVRDIEGVSLTMTVEAGCILRDAQIAATNAGLNLPISLSSEGSCQIGGNIATNAGGTAAVRYGVTRQQVLGLEVVLPSGKVLNKLSRLRKDNAGYDLKNLFIGSEGTLGIITAAVLRLVPAPKVRAIAMLAVDSVDSALQILAKAQNTFGERVAAAEITGAEYLDLVLRRIRGSRLPFSELPHWSFLLEIADTSADAELREPFERLLGEVLEQGLATDAVIAQSEREAEAFWALRHDVSEASRNIGPSMNHDSSVPLEQQQAYYDRTRKEILAEYPDATLLYVGHVGDGNMHLVVLFPPGRFPERAEYFQAAHNLDVIIDRVVLELNGSITAEHGIGLTYRDRYAVFADPDELAIMRGLKEVIDPQNILNPGKIFTASAG